MTKKTRPVCCLCGKECDDEWGNNPWPLSLGDDDRCCNTCNMDVIRARILSPQRIAESLDISLDEAAEKAKEIYEKIKQEIKERE